MILVSLMEVAVLIPETLPAQADPLGEEVLILGMGYHVVQGSQILCSLPRQVV